MVGGVNKINANCVPLRVLCHDGKKTKDGVSVFKLVVAPAMGKYLPSITISRPDSVANDKSVISVSLAGCLELNINSSTWAGQPPGCTDR